MVVKITGIDASDGRVRIMRKNCQPSMRGMCTSDKMMSGGSFKHIASASNPSGAMRT